MKLFKKIKNTFDNLKKYNKLVDAIEIYKTDVKTMGKVLFGIWHDIDLLSKEVKDLREKLEKEEVKLG